MTISATRPGTAMRKGYDAIPLYAPDPSPVAIDLSDNTNRWGMPPAAAREIQRAIAGNLAKYPDAYAASLKQAAARYLDVAPSMIVTGCGSDDVLDSAIRSFAEPGDRVAVLDPSFVMIPTLVRLNGLEPVSLPLSSSYEVNVDSLPRSGEVSVTYLCSPNNPTGTRLSNARATIAAALERTRGIVIMDEAYAEFAGESVVDLVSENDRLIVVRTMSKAFGLASMRVGYAIGAPDVVAEIEKSRGPFKVSALAERAAVVALTEDVQWMKEQVANAIESRERVAAALRAKGFDVIPSSANFLLVPVRQASAVARHMRALGVAVRPFDALPLVSPALTATNGGALRVTVAPWPEMEAMLSALDEAAATVARDARDRGSAA